MRRLALTTCLALTVTAACDGSTTDLVTPSPAESARSIALAPDSAVTALDSSLVNTNPRYRCTMGLRVRGSSTISGETAVWTGGSYQLVATGQGGLTVPFCVGVLVGWFGTDPVVLGVVVVVSCVFVFL